MEKQKILEWATVLNAARKNARPIPQLTQTIRLTRPEAYDIQEKQLIMRASGGEKQIGWKMGLTSEAKRLQMNLDSPLYGFLTDSMQIKNGSEFDISMQIHCKIEPEIAFLISKDLSGIVTLPQVMDSILAVAPALEILDSRYDQFKYFSMEDVISDNSSSSYFVLGQWEKKFKSLDLSHLKLKMKINGEVKQSGTTEAISGNPIVSIIQLCDLLSQRGQKLTAGSIVLAGAATAAEELSYGQVIELTMDDLQDVKISISKKKQV